MIYKHMKRRGRGIGGGTIHNKCDVTKKRPRTSLKFVCALQRDSNQGPPEYKASHKKAGLKNDKQKNEYCR